MKIISSLPILFLLCALSACTNKEKKSQGNRNPVTEIKYARGFSIDKEEKYTTVTVWNPWQEEEIYDKYYLVKEAGMPVPDDGRKVVIPLKTLVANSATHLEFLQMLGVIDRVTGVCNPQYIYNPFILKQVEEGKVKNIGDSYNLDIENLLLLHPQAVMTSAYNAKDENTQKLEQTGLPILYNIEWREKTLLGRAEWIKFVAAFFDKGALADSLFDDIAQRYEKACEKAKTVSGSPIVMAGQDFRGTWSMPAGQSFNAELFRRAGGDYYYAGDSTSGSISTTIENALIRFGNADIWIGAQANTLDELGKTDAKYKLFKAYKDKNVYNYNKRVNANGGNDYWESAVARPDLLLMDMIKAFHSELLPDYEMTYMQKLE